MLEIPECGPARDRLVAEVVGWVFDEATDICWDKFLMRSPSTTPADALAALEAWNAAGATRGYRIDRYGGEKPRYRVQLYPLPTMSGSVCTEAPILPAAATAALLATGEG